MTTPCPTPWAITQHGDLRLSLEPHKVCCIGGREEVYFVALCDDRFGGTGCLGICDSSSWACKNDDMSHMHRAGREFCMQQEIMCRGGGDHRCGCCALCVVLVQHRATPTATLHSRDSHVSRSQSQSLPALVLAYLPGKENHSSELTGSRRIGWKLAKKVGAGEEKALVRRTTLDRGGSLLLYGPTHVRRTGAMRGCGFEG
jgi:hypothetical protein